MANTPLLFRCNVAFEDIPTGKDPALAQFLVYTDIIPPKNATVKRLLGENIYFYLRMGLLATPYREEMINEFKVHRRSFEYYNNQLFQYGIGRLNTTMSEVWLASYIANNYGSKLGYLNEILRRIRIEPEDTEIRTTLEVKWWRVVGILGGLLIFQIVFASVGLWYCHGSMEVVDEVSMYFEMFGEFPYGQNIHQNSSRENRTRRARNMRATLNMTASGGDTGGSLK